MDNKRKSRNYYNQGNYQKRSKQFNIDIGMSGFLCTCNFREKECVRDAYKLLNEYDEIVNSPEQKQQATETPVQEEATNEGSGDNVEDEEEDISSALNKELQELKAESEKPVNWRKFQALETGVKNVVFIKSSVKNPLEIVTKIFEDLDASKQPKSRFIIRLLPIHAITKAYMNDIKAKAEELFQDYFAQEPKTYSIVFNRHYNNNVDRMEVINSLAEVITRMNSGNKADLKNPEIAVVVEVMRGFCLLSIAPNYFKYKKYNVSKIVETEDSSTEKPTEAETVSNDPEKDEAQTKTGDTNEEN